MTKPSPESLWTATVKQDKGHHQTKVTANNVSADTARNAFKVEPNQAKTFQAVHENSLGLILFSIN